MSSSYQSLHGLLVSSLDLAEMRADQTAGLPDTCTVLRGTVTATGSGGGSVTWGTVYANEPCRFYFRWWEVNREDDSYAAREASYQRHAVRVRYDLDIREADRVVFNSRTYEVDLVALDQSWRTVKSAYLNILSGN